MEHYVHEDKELGEEENTVNEPSSQTSKVTIGFSSTEVPSDEKYTLPQQLNTSFNVSKADAASVPCCLQMQLQHQLS